MRSPACVIDAGVAIAWFVEESRGGPVGGKEALALLEGASAGRLSLYAPQLLLAEVTNVLWKLTRFREYPMPGALAAIDALVQSPLRLEDHRPFIKRALEIARDFERSAYDALYVAVAEFHRIPLLTTDRRLINAVSAALPWVLPLRGEE